jgi:hypothetical protein
MEDLIIKETKSTPAVHFSAINGTMNIDGDCISENAHSFFVPLLRWIEDYFDGENPSKMEDYQLNLTCDYTNSSSSKMLVYLFDIAGRIQKEGYKLKVCWNYTIDDPDLVEAIEDYSHITSVIIESNYIEE